MKSVYVLESHGQFKIGVSQDVDTRLCAIRTGNPSVQAIYESDPLANAYKVESMIHRHLAVYRTHGEWFSVSPEVDIVNVVNGFVEKYGVREESPNPEKENTLGKLMEKLFAPMANEIEALDAELEKINIENEKLKKQLRECGWSDFDIQNLVNEAERSVSVQYA